jgi:hypothetical protein
MVTGVAVTGVPTVKVVLRGLPSTVSLLTFW